MNEDRNFTIVAIGTNGKAFNLGTYAAKNPAEAITKARQKNELLAIKEIGELKSFEAEEDFL